MQDWRVVSGTHLHKPRISIVRERLWNMAVGRRASRWIARSTLVRVIGVTRRGAINIRRVR